MHPKTEARKRLLNRHDLFAFDNVPGKSNKIIKTKIILIEINYHIDFIVDSFFDGSSYNKRMLVTELAFLNEIHIDSLLLLISWTPRNNADILKVIQLYKDFERYPNYREKYYSYDVVTESVSFLNGKLIKIIW